MRDRPGTVAAVTTAVAVAITVTAAAITVTAAITAVAGTVTGLLAPVPHPHTAANYVRDRHRAPAGFVVLRSVADSWLAMRGRSTTCPAVTGCAVTGLGVSLRRRAATTTRYRTGGVDPVRRRRGGGGFVLSARSAR
ncbi:hypothetical protein CRM89_14230 [Nocardia sp. FDAARGOS_372]|nr:hypothetical protein CRM89_14230 [Nocardia sp. FDAARGOS_372]